jgi:cysteine desulfurase
MKNIYLDYAATTPVYPEVTAAMLPFFSDAFGNPSAACSTGHRAKDAVDKARQSAARFIDADNSEIIFTSGGTESDNFALTGIALANQSKGQHIITSPLEHHAILETCHFLEKLGFTITILPVDKCGIVDPDSVKRAITSETILVSVMHANNEIGTIQPIAEIGRIAHQAGVYFHTDAVQTFGHIPVYVDEMNIDLLSASSHKLYGPKGVGLVYIRSGVNIWPFMRGGSQEEHRRAGTLNVTGIVGFGAAIEVAEREMAEEANKLSLLRNRLIERITGLIPDTRLNGHPVQRLPNNANVCISFLEGESICLNLDMEGICASTGSACNSDSGEPSHVLKAIGLSNEQARGSMRFTLGKWTTEDDINRVITVLPCIVKRLRSISPLVK